MVPGLRRDYNWQVIENLKFLQRALQLNYSSLADARQGRCCEIGTLGLLEPFLLLAVGQMLRFRLLSFFRARDLANVFRQPELIAGSNASPRRGCGAFDPHHGARTALKCTQADFLRGSARTALAAQPAPTGDLPSYAYRVRD